MSSEPEDREGFLNWDLRNEQEFGHLTGVRAHQESIVEHM